MNLFFFLFLIKFFLLLFLASIKDGYAVISDDKAGLRKVIGASNAGNEPEKLILQPRECVRINTGAPVPEGADAVVQVEDTELTKTSDDGKEEVEIKILSEPKPGQDIRPLGSDIQAGMINFIKCQRIHMYIKYELYLNHKAFFHHFIKPYMFICL